MKEWPRSPTGTDPYISSGGNVTYEGSSSNDHYQSSGRETAITRDVSPFSDFSDRSGKSKTEYRRTEYDKGRNKNIQDSKTRRKPLDGGFKLAPESNNSYLGRIEQSDYSGSDRSERYRDGSGSPTRIRKRRSSKHIRSHSVENKAQTGGRIVITKKTSYPEIHTEDFSIDETSDDMLHNQNKMVPFNKHISNYSAYAQNFDREGRLSRESRTKRDSRHSRESRYSSETRYSKDSFSSIEPDRRESTQSINKCNSPTFNTLRASRKKLLETVSGNNNQPSRFSHVSQFIVSGGNQPRESPSTVSITSDISNDTPRDIENVYHSYKRKVDRNLRPERLSSTNSLSPDMARYGDQRRKRSEKLRSLYLCA